MTVSIYDETPCTLGEGALWHPERQQLFWFDIIGKRLLTREGGVTRDWTFDEHVSAAGWIGRDQLLVASETALSVLDLVSGRREMVHPLEAKNPATRSNDGRADPWGGFWIGTMGKRGEADAGAIYRMYRGEVRWLHSPITIPNAICFSQDRQYAYFADTPRRTIWRQRLRETDGWPVDDPEVFVDGTSERLLPDGAVVDTEGQLWNAQWGAGRVVCYDREGLPVKTIAFPVPNTTCPAFGGPDLGTLYVTSARQGMSAEAKAAHPASGKTFTTATDAHGQAEPKVIL